MLHVFVRGVFSVVSPIPFVFRDDQWIPQPMAQPTLRRGGHHPQLKILFLLASFCFLPLRNHLTIPQLVGSFARF